MADIATLGLRLDANGFVNSTQQVSGVLDGLGESSRKVQNKIQNFATAGGFALGSLASGGVKDITSVLRSFSGLGFAIGPVTGAIALAVSSIGIAFFESQKQAREATQKMIDDLHNMEREFSESAKRMRLSTLTAQRDAILDKIETTPAWTIGPRGMPLKTDYVAMSAEADKLSTRIAAVRDSLMDMARAAQAAWNADAPKRLAAELARQAEYAKDLATAVGIYAKALADAYDEHRRFVDSSTDMSDTQTKFNTELAETIRLMGIQLKKMDEQAEKAKRNKELIFGAAAGVVAGVFQSGGGAMGAAAGAAIGAVASGATPVGIAVAAFSALTESLLNAGDAAKAAANEMRGWLRAQGDFIDSQKVALGTMTGLEYSTNRLTREFAEARDVFTGTKQQLDALNALEAARILQLQQEAAELTRRANEDLNVRRLRALGATEDADAMAFALAQQREYADAVKAGADATTLAALAEVHRVEKLNWAMGKIQARIDELARTIDGLEAFKSSLLMSATQSPNDRYAEAARQYNDVLAQAQAGDQGAAGRLPAVAQAFLEASRAINASGPAFQAHFQRVVEDTQALIDQFKLAKTIEELQLEVLRQIRDGIELHRGPLPDPLGMPGDPGTEIPTATLTAVQASVTALTEGFTRTLARLDTLASKVDEGTATSRRGFEGLGVNGARLN